MTSLHHIAKAIDSTAVRKIAAEPMGAVKLFNFTVKSISYTLCSLVSHGFRVNSSSSSSIIIEKYLYIG
ncbi:MAG: hypothetical protein OFPII_40720 [Osedax symbiont Rs1]|nr:MAG: hypothetical protein OFPII_40720 [Osedax symbiont Rs1]